MVGAARDGLAARRHSDMLVRNGQPEHVVVAPPSGARQINFSPSVEMSFLIRWFATKVAADESAGQSNYSTNLQEYNRVIPTCLLSLCQGHQRRLGFSFMTHYRT